MNVESDFLRSLATYFNKASETQPPLLNCLVAITKKLGLQIKSEINDLTLLPFTNNTQFSDSLGIILILINQPDINKLSNTCFPLLIQDQAGHLWVYLGKKSGKNHVLDAVKNKQILLNDSDLLLKFHQVWQCSPINFNLITHFKNLIYNLVKHFKRSVVIILTVGLIFSMLTAAITALTGYFIAHISLMNSSWMAMNYLPLLWLFVGMALLAYLNELLQNGLTTKVIIHALPAVWNQFLKLLLLASQAHSAGDLTQRLADYELALTTIIPVVLTMLFNIFSLLFIFAYLVFNIGLLACAFLFISILFLAIKLLIIPLNVKHIREEFNAHGVTAGFLNEIFLQIHKIRAAGAEGMVFKKWLNYWVALKSHSERTIKLKIILMLFDISLPLVLLLIFYRIIYTSPHQQSVFWLQFMVCAGQFTIIFDKFSKHISTLLHYVPTLQRIATLLPEPVSTQEKKITISNTEGAITFSKVSFIDVSSGRVILNDVSFTIKAGEFIGIIGESGAGKSTLFKLLLGLENIATGRISLDNININHIDNYSLRKQFGVVLQNSNIFPGTIFSNLSINKVLTLDEAWQLAEAVGLAEDIQRMPMKMYTYLSDNAGESISGGQKQKILIARAIATNPRILLLDEATSALDTISQSRIYHYLKTLHITRIVIAHRHNTLTGADKIFLLKNGSLNLLKNFTIETVK